MDAAQAAHYLGNKDYYNGVKMTSEGLGVVNSAADAATKIFNPFGKIKLKPGEAHINMGTGQILKEGK